MEGTAVPECLDRVHALLDELWADAPWVEEARRARFTTAVAELVANVVEHGGSGGAPPRLSLTLAAEGRELRAVLVDDGAVVPDGGAPGEEGSLLAESGRGLLLVHLVADAVAYERAEQANHWELVVHA